MVGIQQRQSVKTMKKKRTAISTSLGANGVACWVRRMLRNSNVYTSTITRTLREKRSPTYWNRTIQNRIGLVPYAYYQTLK